MKDYMLEQYESYMANNCTCDRSDEECCCLTYDDFCTQYLLELQEEWAALICETQYVDILA